MGAGCKGIDLTQSPRDSPPISALRADPLPPRFAWGQSVGGLGEIVRDGQKTRFARRMRRGMTPAEVLLWSKLRRSSQGWRFRRQPPPYVLDFACVEIKLAIEVDGATHAADDEIAHDARRTAYLEERGWRVVRFWNREIFENLAGAVDTIRYAAWEQENWLARSPESP